jgi:hypothetical protein
LAVVVPDMLEEVARLTLDPVRHELHDAQLSFTPCAHNQLVGLVILNGVASSSVPCRFIAG